MSEDQLSSSSPGSSRSSGRSESTEAPPPESEETRSRIPEERPPESGETRSGDGTPGPGETRPLSAEAPPPEPEATRTPSTEVPPPPEPEVTRTPSTEAPPPPEPEATRTLSTEAPPPPETEATRTLSTEERPPEGAETRTLGTDGPPPKGAENVDVDLSPYQFRLRRFFVLRPGTLNQGIKDAEALVDKEVDGDVRSIWLMAEVDHWNNEKERLVFITDNSLLIFKYDFVMLRCDQIQRIPLNFVDRISYGAFSFPKHSLLRRDGEGVRVYWDRPREPSFVSRWNPFASDFPFVTFTQHPVKDINGTLAALSDIDSFRTQLRDAALRLHAARPVPGKANGVMVLNQPLLIEAYVGLMSVLGNQNKLGYCMARGNLGY